MLPHSVKNGADQRNTINTTIVQRLQEGLQVECWWGAVGIAGWWGIEKGADGHAQGGAQAEQDFQRWQLVATLNLANIGSLYAASNPVCQALLGQAVLLS
jgi:hypothetical protein